MRVLIACEFSGRVRDAFLLVGHDAYSCDLRACWPSTLVNYRDAHQRHIKGDVRPILKRPWDLVICHPPCTYLCNSGVTWLSIQKGRYDKMVKAAIFFLDCLLANSPLIAVENPIQHKYARGLINESYTQIIHPYEFGEVETKSTCLWLKGLPPLIPTEIVDKDVREGKLHKLPPSSYRSQLRAVTSWGVAKAMASQWGNLQR